MTFGGSLAGTEEDVQRWEAAGERGVEILEWVTVLRLGGIIAAVDSWHDPCLNEAWNEARCPWVVEENDGTYSCGIYDLRPDVCREYPARWEQIESMCIPGGVEVRLKPTK